MSERFPGEFDDLAQRLMEGGASQAERLRLAELLRGDVALRERYAELMQVHALLVCRYRGVEGGTARQAPRRAAAGRWRGWWKAAAAAAVLAAGAWTGVIWMRGGGPRMGVVSLGPRGLTVTPVALLKSERADGLSLPQKLPGRLRLASGVAKVKLGSGVELALVGPVRLHVLDAMEVRLDSGRLVARVPARASGFTVVTPHMTVWDIGTEFSVSADRNGSGVFVFQGCVQVLDEEGEGIGLCERGEGVLAEPDQPAVRFSVEEAEAGAVLAGWDGKRAVDAPQQALSAAWQVAVTWAARNMPGLAARTRAVLMSGRSIKSMAQFVAVPEEEESVMNMKNVAAVAAVTLSAWASNAAETNIVSFAYSTSLPPHVSTPDDWARRLNDGFWTNSVADGVRYDGDVTVTLDLGEVVPVAGVTAHTFTSGGATPLETRGVALACGNDGQTWAQLGALQAEGAGRFANSGFYANARYLRLVFSKTEAATGQSLAEIVVEGRPPTDQSLLTYSYTASVPYNSNHGDSSMNRLYDGLWTNAATQSVQYGANGLASVDPEDPSNGIASNVVISASLTAPSIVRRAHVYAFRSNTANGFDTARVTLSNSLDGVTWTCAGVQTVYEVPSTGVSRFDFTLPNVEARYLAFACEKSARSDITRQLIGEIQIVGSGTAPRLGEPLAFTYEANMASTSSHDNSACPKLTDGVWDHVTRNAIRYMGDVQITADLGTARYVAGAQMICWSNKFSGSETYYGTGRVVVHGSLDKQNWTQLGEILNRTSPAPFRHAVAFRDLPYVRYLRFDAYRYENPAHDVTAQILGELTIYRPPATTLGAAPVAVADAIPFAGFETDPLLPEFTLVRGGEVNGWTFSYANTANYAGYQINGSPVSTNAFSTRYYAPEGVQTAVLMGSGTMETQLSVPEDGSYALQFRVNGTVYSPSNENGGYDFRVRVGGVDMGVVTVAQLTNTVQEIMLAGIKGGAYALRFEGVNSRSVTWGALIDDLVLKRYAVPAANVKEQGYKFVLAADSAAPLALSYDGALAVKELWVDGALQQPGKYGATSYPAVFSAAGVIRYKLGTLLSVR